MSGPSFQLVAATAGCDRSAVERIADALGDAFDVDLSGLIDALSQTGVCVYTSQSLREIQEKGQLVLGAGGNFRILDQAGSVIEEGSPQRSPPQNVEFGTMLGGYHAPGSGGFLAPAGPREKNLLSASLDDLLPLDEATGSVDLFAPPAAGRGAVEPSGAFRLTSSPSGVVRVGKVEGASDDPSGAGRLPSGSSAAIHGMGAAGRSARAPGSGGPTPSSASASAFSPPGSFGPAEVDAPLELAEPYRSEPSNPAIQAPATGERSDRREGSFMGPIQRVPTARGSARIVPVRTAARRKDRFLLFSGQLREMPRMRLMLGFAVALGMSSVVPLIHASSVYAREVEPLRKKLSFTKAYAHILSTRPHYQQPEDIEKEIEEVARRGSAFTFGIWSALCGFVLLLWFRFT